MILPIAYRISDPAVDGGFPPARAVDADLDLRRESPFIDLAIEGCTRQSSASEHGLDADNSISVMHGNLLPFCDSQWLPMSRALTIKIRPASAFLVNLSAAY